MAELRIGVRELKTHLSRYLQQMRQGTTIVVTDRGRPMGRLLPVAAPLEQRLAAAQAAGLIAWSGRPLAPRAPVAVTRGPKTVAELLIEDRE